MKFVLFQMAEYLNLITASAIATTLFLGGWNGPGVERFPLLSLFYFAIKVLALIFIAMWIRYTVPRFRYDQLMRFGWRVLLPFAIINIIIVSTIVLIIS
jgi:NADH-quinone oxidoreductase subunit H